MTRRFVDSPLLRFYLALVLTVLLLVVSISQLYRVLQTDQSPQLEVRNLLAQAQKKDAVAPFVCAEQGDGRCESALFVRYAASLDYKVPTAGGVLTLQASDGSLELCQREPAQTLLCLRAGVLPATTDWHLDLAYVFYFLLLLALFVFSRALFSDVMTLRHTALTRIRHGSLPEFQLSPHSYLSPLADALKKMTQQIGQLNRFQLEMADTVCHDIKTPLARLKFISHLLTPERLAKSREEILANVGEIEVNVYEYLRLSQNDGAEQALCWAAIDPREFCHEVISAFQLNSPVAITWQVDAAVPPILFADRMLLRRALGNLLSNAQRFAKKQVQCQVQVLPVGMVQFVVEDDGPGMGGSAEQQDAWELAHHGLGLTIVRRVMSKHQGRLEVGVSKLGGACCSLQLPLIEHVPETSS